VLAATPSRRKVLKSKPGSKQKEAKLSRNRKRSVLANAISGAATHSKLQPRRQHAQACQSIVVDLAGSIKRLSVPA